MSSQKTPTQTQNTMIRTRDGHEMEKSQTLTLNPERLVFVSKLLRERLRLDRNSDIKALVKTSDPKTEEGSNLRTLYGAEANLATLREKGPEAIAFAADDSSLAQMVSNLLAAPNVSTPPKTWGDYKVPDLFVPLPAAEEKWLIQKAARDAREAEKDRERQAAKAEAERLEREAQAERERQALAKSDAADALFALADMDVVASVAEKLEEKVSKADEAKVIRDARLEQASEFFRKALKGELSALLFRTKAGKYYVSRDDNDILSTFRIADYAGADPSTEIYSAVDGSMFVGKLGDTHPTQDGKSKLSNWMCAKFKVRLHTADGRPSKEMAEGYVIMDSREGTTMKNVAKELGILTDDPASQLTFWKTYRLQTLSKAAEYEADKIAQRHNKQNGASDPNPEPEPTNGNSNKPRVLKPRRKSDEDGQKTGRPETAPPEITLGDDGDNDEPTKESAPVEPVNTTGITVGDETPLSHSPFAALSAKIK